MSCILFGFRRVHALKLTKLQESYLGERKITRGIHLVNWARGTKPKKIGGLSVRECRLPNIALLGKLVWNIVNESGRWLA